MAFENYHVTNQIWTTKTTHNSKANEIFFNSWKKGQLKALTSVLLPTATPEAIDAVLIDFCRGVLVSRFDALQEARKQAKYLPESSSPDRVRMLTQSICGVFK